MLKIKKHIAVVLLGIFFFPIAFQSFHKVWHHSISYSNNKHSDHTEVSSKIFPKDTLSISQYVNYCPICKYEFSISNILNTVHFELFIPFAVGVLNTNITEQPYLQLISIKSPRAPPFIALT